MNSTTIPLSKTGFFSNLVLDYIAGNARLKEFYKYPVALESFSTIIADKKKQVINREVLVTVLNEQYGNVKIGAEVRTNIDSLKNDNTFTITTAHQPNLFLGPLYFLYKIASVINLSKQAQQKNTGNKIVPVFWMGSEDHDVDELAHIFISGRKFEWSPGQHGAFGRMNAETLEPLINELKTTLDIHPGSEAIVSLLKEAYNGKNTIAEAARILINSLFGHEGIIVMDGDDSRLKAIFIPVIEAELFNQQSEKLVNPSIQKLEENYPVQAKSRPINLFYLKDDRRSRIEKMTENKWNVVNTSITFSASELKAEIKQFPERFSPNVLLRGLYQEMILPNLAFVGGGAEVSYWFELKPLFEHYKVNYPAVILRASCLLIDKVLYSRAQKLGFDLEDIFLPIDSLIKKYVLEKDGGLHLNGEKEKLNELFEQLKVKAGAVDPTLEASVMSEKAKLEKSLETIEQKMLRAEKRKQEQAVNQITSLKEKLFPGNQLQERVENFLPFYQKYGNEMLTELIASLNPLQKEFVILTE